jgi:heme oxygenase (mycobilin-producing)
MGYTVLINAFEVSADREEEFLENWQRVADYVATQPGYVSTRLHRALSPDSRFRFVNVAEYESPKHFQDIAASAEFRERGAALRDFPSNPALYAVVRSDHV